MGSEVKDPVWSCGDEGTLHVCRMGNVTVDPAEILNVIQAGSDCRRLENREHVVTVGDQTANEVGADKTGGATYETADGSSSPEMGLTSGTSADGGGLRMLLTMYAGRRLTSS